jgi:O-6-methylguanine DNA methyltransferase
VVVGPDGLQGVGFDTAPPADALHDEHLDAAEQLRAWVRGDRRGFDLQLALHGTPFQEEVWGALLEVPYGATTTYGALARALGRPVGAARAIGAANGANPLALVVPCHRVVGGDGALVGYAGGLDRKRWLLGHERGQTALFG